MIATICTVSAALSDPTRVRLLAALGDGGLPVGRLAHQLGVTSATVSHHLARLEEVGLVGVHRRGRHHVVRRHERRWRQVMAAFGDDGCV